MDQGLYDILKRTGAITPEEVPSELVTRLAEENNLQGNQEEIKASLSVLSRVANSSTKEEFFLAIARGNFNAVKLSPSQIAGTRGPLMAAPSASQDGCIVEEGTCVP